MSNEELKQLASLALRNAFWRDFSGLVNRYLEASDGLDVGTQERQMGEMTSIYGRDEHETSGDTLNIYSTGPSYRDCGHATLVEALELSEATEVFLQGLRVFERRGGEWYFVGDARPHELKGS